MNKKIRLAHPQNIMMAIILGTLVTIFLVRNQDSKSLMNLIGVLIGYFLSILCFREAWE